MDDVLNNSYGHIFGAKIKVNQSILYCVVHHSKQLTIQYTILSSQYERLQSLSLIYQKTILIYRKVIWQSVANVLAGPVACLHFIHPTAYTENSPLDKHFMCTSATFSHSLPHSLLKTKKLPTWNFKCWSHSQSGCGVSNENVQAYNGFHPVFLWALIILTQFFFAQ